ncbi:MAG: hypothetical protein ABSD61_12750, partial [Terracidiphilus sp.]
APGAGPARNHGEITLALSTEELVGKGLPWFGCLGWSKNGHLNVSGAGPMVSSRSNPVDGCRRFADHARHQICRAPAFERGGR